MAKVVVPETEDATLTDTPPHDLDPERDRGPEPDRSPEPDPPASGPPVGEATSASREGARGNPHPRTTPVAGTPSRWCGTRRPGSLSGLEDLTFEKLLGYVFAPVAFVIGVPWSEAVTAGSFLGQKLILNEFVAFTNFGPEVDSLSDKTVAVVTFALCGFANFGSFAILLGGLAQIAPRRRGSVARLGIRAVLAGTLANLLNAAVAGMFV